MNVLSFILIIVLSSAPMAFGQSHTYFVSSDGNDTNSGLSLKAAWKTLERVNRETFRPGDTILFKSGDVWKGQLQPLGSGAPGQPIRIDRYGEGPLPIINLGEATGPAVKLANQEWWEIRRLEVTSGAPPHPLHGRQGIVALADQPGSQTSHIVISDCYIHDIWGLFGGPGNFTNYNSAGIYVGDPGRTGGKASDISIERNKIERIDRCGIILRGGGVNILIRGNYMENLGGDGIFADGCRGGLIERNIVRRSCMRTGDPNVPTVHWPHSAAIWLAGCLGTIMQYNEVYDTGKQPLDNDGMAYDFDFWCKRCILQYNYSRNNAGGFGMFMQNTYENIMRYNISENDQDHMIQMFCDISDRNLVYNNIFYVDYGSAHIDFYGSESNANADRTQVGAYFRNNIFYATGQGRFEAKYTTSAVPQWRVLSNGRYEPVRLIASDRLKSFPPPASSTYFLRNCYFGPWLNGLPNDAEKIEADPMFVAPGRGGNGLATLAGYKLRLDSPCINKGVRIAGDMNADFYGNPVNDGALDIGVFEQPGSGAVNDPGEQERLNRREAALSRLGWTKKTLFPESVQLPEEGGDITIAAIERNIISSSRYVDDSAEGASKATLTWVAKDWSIQPETVDMKTLSNGKLTFKFSPVGQASSPPALVARTEEDGQKDEWNIPVYLSHRIKMGSLPNARIDGDVVEWKNVPALAVNSAGQVFQLRDKWKGPEDGSCSLKAAVSGTNLVLAIEATDSDYSDTGAFAWLNDGVQVYFDARRPEERGRMAGSGTGRLLLTAQDKDGPLERALWAQQRDTQPLPPEAKTAYRRSRRGYVIELSIPFALMGLPAAPATGENIALEIVLDNLKGSGDSTYKIRMSGSGHSPFEINSNTYNRFVVP
jgi:hypothetical protein